MKKLLLLIGLITSVSGKAQTFEKIFSLGTAGNTEYGNASFELENGNYLLGINNNILCLSSSGDSLWTKNYATYGYVYKIFRDQNGKLMIATTSGKMLFANINESNGDVISSFYAPKQFSNSGYTIYDVEVLANGDYVISYNNGGGNAAIIQCFTPQATNYNWSNDYAGQGYSPKNVLVDDTSFVLAGYLDVPTWNKDFQVMKLSSKGTMLWKKSFTRNSTGYDRLVGLQKNSIGNYLAATSMVKNDKIYPAVVVVSSNGDSIAVNTFDNHNGKSLNHGYLYDLSVAGSGFYAAGFINVNDSAPDQSVQGVGYMSAFEISNEGQFTASSAFNQLGVFEYATGYYDGSDAWGNNIIKTSDGNYLLSGVGSKQKGNSTVWKGYVVKSDQFLSYVANETSVNDKVATFSVFPNPSSSLLNVQAAIENQSVNVVLCNGVGQTVYQAVGLSSTNISLDVSALSAGYYLLQVFSTEGFLLGKASILVQ